MIEPSFSATVVTLASLLLLLSYGLGAPTVLLRTVSTITSRRRKAFRPRDDEERGSERFMIPVSVVLPLDADARAPVEAVRSLLTLDYPALEVVVVARSAPAAVAALREAFDLKACEIFYRRVIGTRPVRTLYRSPTTPALLVVDTVDGGHGDALNCGVNLARYRYVCCAIPGARYDRSALRQAMRPVAEDAATVVGVTTALTPAAAASSGGVDAVQRVFGYLAAARGRLNTTGYQRLRLAPPGPVGFTLWRRDVVLDAGGFASDVGPVHVDLTLRIHRRLAGTDRPYDIVHLARPVGTTLSGGAGPADLAPLTWSVLWRNRALVFNPWLGRLGLFDLPRFAVGTLLAPWVELAALAAVAAAAPLGVLTAGEALTVVLVVCLGHGILVDAGLLVEAGRPRSARPLGLGGLVLLGPIEYLYSKPVFLVQQLRALRGMSASRP